MEYRKSALLLTVMFLAVTMVPMVAEDADASTESPFPDYIIVDVVGTDVDLVGGSSIPLDAESGSTTVITICFINTSTDPQDVCLVGITGMEDYNISIEPSVDDYVVLDSSGPKYITLTIDVDIFADNGDYISDFHISGYAPYTQAHFDWTVSVNTHVTSPLHSEGMYNKFFGIYPNTLPGFLGTSLFAGIVTLFIWILLALIINRAILPPIARSVERRYPDSNFKEINKSLRRMILAIMIFTGLGEGLQVIGSLPEVIHMFNTISGTVYVCLGAVIAWDVWKVLINILVRIFDEVDVAGVDSSLKPLFKMIGRILICVVAVTIILASFGVDLAGILVSAGVISLGITLGAQNILGQFFSGIVLLSTRPFQNGDYVKINNTVYTVHNVKVMFTEFKNWDNDQIITMPNNAVTNATIVNLTRGSKDTRIFIFMSVAYEADQEKAKELLSRAAYQHPHVITDGSKPLPNIRLTNFLDSGIEYRLACFVDDFDNSAHYAGQIREIIFALFKENDVEIPYNKIEITVFDGSSEGADAPSRSV